MTDGPPPGADPAADLPAAPRAWTVPPHPGASSAEVSARMSRHPRRDTLPELAVRRLLHAAGWRYRVGWPVPGQRRRTIDIAFTRRKVAVFLDGCFWHGCPDHGTSPRSNAAWWRTKIDANRARDRDTDGLLAAQGWTVLRFWEHAPPAEVAEAVAAALRGADPDGPTPPSRDARPARRT